MNTPQEMLMNESEEMKYYNLDESDWNPNPKPKSYFSTLNPTTLLEQLAFVFAKSATRPTMNAHAFMNYEHEFDLTNSYVPTKEETLSILDERTDATNNKPIEGVGNVQFGDVVDK